MCQWHPTKNVLYTTLNLFAVILSLHPLKFLFRIIIQFMCRLHYDYIISSFSDKNNPCWIEEPNIILQNWYICFDISRIARIWKCANEFDSIHRNKDKSYSSCHLKLYFKTRWYRKLRLLMTCLLKEGEASTCVFSLHTLYVA